MISASNVEEMLDRCKVELFSMCAGASDNQA